MTEEQHYSEGPGPAQYSPEHNMRITNKGVDSTPSFSMRGRPKYGDQPKDISPGPIYSPEITAAQRFRRAPSYSISCRPVNTGRNVSPGPNAYTIPTTLGSKVPDKPGGPAVGFRGRSDINSIHHDYTKGPGPASIGSIDPNVTYKRGPSFSMAGRVLPLPSKNVTPGPGAYSPENVSVHMKSSPRFSIGVRHGGASLPLMTLADISD